MKIGDFEVFVEDQIMIVTNKKRTVKLEDVKEIREILKETLNKTYNYVIYNSLLGYYSGYDFLKEKSVYCGSMNKATNIKKMKRYIEDEMV